MLPALKIKNFKNIKHLTLPELKQVNLFTGKNNVGKSSLLEAVFIFINKGDLTSVYDIVSNRKHGDKERVSTSNYRVLSSLFYKNSLDNKIEITVDEPIEAKLEILDRKHESAYLQYLQDNEKSANYEYSTNGDVFILFTGENVRIQSKKENIHILSQNASLQQNIQLWDKIVLTDKEDQVVEALQIIEPRIQRLAFIDRAGERVAMVRLKGGEQAVELQSMGDGINRILSIVLAAVNVADGYLLIDEFENGLHYSVQEQLWRVLFGMAEKLNIQLFATTHSSDCIDSFEEVLNEQSTVSGQLFRLEKGKDGAVKTVSYDKEELQIATDNDIETR